jgi:hypothetical protein
MKKSAQVTLTVVGIMGLASCNRHRDPCKAETFSEQACQQAVQSGGYHYGGHWYPMTYGYPYPYYYDSYRTHVSRGGAVRPAPSGSYAAPSSTSRGGFGSIGAGHSVGS